MKTATYPEISPVEQTPNQIYLAAEKFAMERYTAKCEDALREYNAVMATAMAQYRRALKMAPTALNRGGK